MAPHEAIQHLQAAKVQACLDHWEAIDAMSSLLHLELSFAQSARRRHSSPEPLSPAGLLVLQQLPCRDTCEQVPGTPRSA